MTTANRHGISSKAHKLLAIALLSAAVFAQGCALDFTGDNFQRFKTFFKLTEALVQGEATLVHTWFFPSSVKVRKRWVEVSGRATAADGGTVPANATVVARFADLDSDKQKQKITFKLKIDGDGMFSVKKKIKKDIAANTLMTVTVMPVGNDFEEGTELVLCVDIGENKADLNNIPACVESGGGNGGAATLSELQTDIFSPSCDSFGCHNADSARAGLVLTAGMSFDELVGVPSFQQPGIDRVEPGDAENSYLIQKLRGDAGIDGDRMPDDGPPFLSDEQLARVVSWINDGAQDN